MDKNKLERVLAYSSSAILAGAAIYLNKNNKKLNKDNKTLIQEYEKTRKEILKIKNNLEIFLLGLKRMHKKYLLLGDSLLEHVKSMAEDMQDLSELNTDYFSEKFPEKDIQFFTPDMLMTKISGLVDAFILNKWSYFPKEEKKKIPKKKLNNNKSLDIYNRNDISLVLKKLKSKNFIEENDLNFILNLYDYFKGPVLERGKVIDYDEESITFYFKYMLDMIIKR